MQITVSAETIELLVLKRSRLGGTTQGMLLGNVLNALRDRVPEDQREEIRCIATGIGTWEAETRVVELSGVEMEETLQKCAKALGLSIVDAFTVGIDELPAPSELFPG